MHEAVDLGINGLGVGEGNGVVLVALLLRLGQLERRGAAGPSRRCVRRPADAHRRDRVALPQEQPLHCGVGCVCRHHGVSRGRTRLSRAVS